MYKSLAITCTNIPTSNQKSKFLIDKKRITMLKNNVIKYKRLYYTRHNDLRKYESSHVNDDDLNINKVQQIYSWKMISEICDSIYTLQKEIYESLDESDL